jgi:hypothetical protein
VKWASEGGSNPSTGANENHEEMTMGFNHTDHAERLGDYNFAAGCNENGQRELLARTTRIVHSWTNGEDEPRFAWVVETDTGFAFVEGWHDYTGWDCQSGIDVHEYETERDAINGAGDDLRRLWTVTP